MKFSDWFDNNAWWGVWALAAVALLGLLTGFWPIAVFAGGVLVLFFGALLLSYLALPFVMLWGAWPVEIDSAEPPSDNAQTVPNEQHRSSSVREK